MQSFQTDEKKSQHISTLDLPLNSTSSINLLVHIVALSKFFLKKDLLDKKIHENAADSLIAHILSADIERDAKISKRTALTQGFVALAKADLFPELLLKPSDREAMKPCGIFSPKPKGENIAHYLSKNKIHTFIDEHVKSKYHSDLKNIVDLAIALGIIGFASHNLLTHRREFDKIKKLATEYDPQNIIAGEKSNIIKSISNLSGLKPTTTRSGEISTYQQLIAADIDQIRNKWESIELDILKKNNKQLKEILSVLQKPRDNESVEKKLQKNITAPTSKSEAESKEQDTQQTKLIATLVMDNQALKDLAQQANQQVHEMEVKHTTRYEDLNNNIQKLANENNDLNIQITSDFQAIDQLSQELYDLQRRKTPWWHYAVAVSVFAAGIALLATGIGSLIVAATALTYLAVTLGGFAALTPVAYIGKKIYDYFRADKMSMPDSPTTRQPLLIPITYLTLPKRKNAPTISSSPVLTPVTYEPLFSQPPPPKLLSEQHNNNPYKKLN